MTHVVTENCIKCKYTDCVDVCPVDCFREGPNFLVIDPDECLDCAVCIPECPTNAIMAEEFLQHFDGFSIGSNDMTQLALGLDRDSGVVSELFDERNDAVKALLSMAIRAAKKQGKYVGICGQGPSDHEDFAAWLMEEGIDSLSLNPDTVVQTWLSLAELKK